MGIVNVGYASTNYYVIRVGRSYLLVDVGFPGTLPKLRHSLERAGITLRAVEHLLATHYHPDHAGLAPELQREGVRLIVLEPQLPSVPWLGQYMKPEHHFRPIALADCLVSSLAESRAVLRRLGLDGELIATPGHSDDSVTLILDDGLAFTGDLPPPFMAPAESGAVERSWEAIRARAVRTVYPGHGPSFRL